MDFQLLTIIALSLIAGILLAALFWPKSGLVRRWKTWRTALQRQQIEDALKYVFNLQQEEQDPSVDALSGAMHLSQRAALRLISQMQTQGLIEQHRSRLHLTTEGQRWAIQIVRAHRLWERYLADEARMPLEKIHEMAHRLEHRSSPAQIEDLDAALGHPSRDPHGDPIPNAAGLMRKPAASAALASALTDWPVGERGRIVHLEDEPPVAYAKLIAEGLGVDQWLTVLEKDSARITLTDGQREMTIAPAIAANVYLEKPVEVEAEPQGMIPLSELKSRLVARIVKLDERCQGFTRRRFLDLGLTPGTEIFPELENSFREPRAYRVRGTLIALRNEQADLILVEPAVS